MSFVVGVLVLIAGHVAVAGTVLTPSNALALAGFVESLLVAAGVFGSVGEARNSFRCFDVGLK